jgi:hypothetical protein
MVEGYIKAGQAGDEFEHLDKMTRLFLDDFRGYGAQAVFVDLAIYDRQIE